MTQTTRRSAVWFVAGALLLGAAAFSIGIALSDGTQPTARAAAAAPEDNSDPVIGAVLRSEANWVPKPDGMPTIDETTSPGALQFPRGTDYADAITSIFTAQQRGDRIPAAKLVAPLPGHAVLMENAGGLTVDLRAPYGWSPQSRLIFTAVVQQDGSLTPDEASSAWRDGSPWPEGGRLGVPELPACQRIATRDAAQIPCGEDDLVAYGAPGPTLPSLP